MKDLYGFWKRKTKKYKSKASHMKLKHFLSWPTVCVTAIWASYVYEFTLLQLLKVILYSCSVARCQEGYKVTERHVQFQRHHQLVYSLTITLINRWDERVDFLIELLCKAIQNVQLKLSDCNSRSILQLLAGTRDRLIVRKAFIFILFRLDTQFAWTVRWIAFCCPYTHS